MLKVTYAVNKSYLVDMEYFTENEHYVKFELDNAYRKKEDIDKNYARRKPKMRAKN